MYCILSHGFLLKLTYKELVDVFVGFPAARWSWAGRGPGWREASTRRPMSTPLTTTTAPVCTTLPLRAWRAVWRWEGNHLKFKLILGWSFVSVCDKSARALGRLDRARILQSVRSVGRALCLVFQWEQLLCVSLPSDPSSSSSLVFKDCADFEVGRKSTPWIKRTWSSALTWAAWDKNIPDFIL